jgi:Rrf2 family iron-sulfur cluster assembly transcriptional regulator
LARTAQDTSVADIVLAVNEPLRATRCAGQGSPKGCMLGGERCLTHNLWEQMGNQIHNYLAGVSLDDVASGRLSSAPARAA